MTKWLLVTWVSMTAVAAVYTACSKVPDKPNERPAALKCVAGACDDEVAILHDDVRGVTCYQGWKQDITCIPDSLLTKDGGK